MAHLTLDDKLDSTMQDLLVECARSFKTHCQVFLPERFNSPFSKIIHDPIFDVLESDAQRIVIVAPRGTGKTSTFNIGYGSWNLLFGQKKYFVPISATEGMAIQQSENLKNELIGNIDILKVFGDIRGDEFSKERWTTKFGSLVMPRGAGQQIRGLLHGINRPDLFVLDDLETDEGVINEDTRKKTKEWFLSNVMNAVDRPKKNWRIVVVGTLLHEDSLLANLIDDPNWVHLHVGICDQAFKSNWPEKFPDSEITSIVEQYRAQRQMDIFAREYLGQATHTENASFSKEFFKYYEETEAELNRNHDIENIVIVDPAKSKKKTSDYSAIVGWGVNMKTNALYVRDLVMKRLRPDEIIEESLAMCERLRARVLGVEITGLNEFATYPFKTEMTKRGLSIELVELHARGKKEDRIGSLIPFYRQGLVFHRREVTGPLEAQLLSFPRSKFDDAMDGASYIVPMLEKGERYFSQVDESPEEVEKEYDELRDEDERSLEGWMIA
jgi:predicted phage terminase large subunit-like protein